jgi:hypothetical protein
MVFITIRVNAEHVSGSSSAHHQELKTVYTASGICRAFLHLTTIVTVGTTQKQKKLDKYPMLCIQFLAPDDGRKNRLKHVEQL